MDWQALLREGTSRGGPLPFIPPGFHAAYQAKDIVCPVYGPYWAHSCLFCQELEGRCHHRRCAVGDRVRRAAGLKKRSHRERRVARNTRLSDKELWQAVKRSPTSTVLEQKYGIDRTYLKYRLGMGWTEAKRQATNDGKLGQDEN
jgi:hypothetical protein